MKITYFYDVLKKNKLVINLLLILMLIYPISIVAGPALIEITIFFSVIITLSIFRPKELKKFFFQFNIKYLLLSFVVLITSSLLSNNILPSLKSSFFSLRFFLFSIVFLIILNNFKEFGKLFFYICLFFFIVCVFDGYLNIFFDTNIFLVKNEIEGPITGLFFEEKKLGRYLITITPILVALYLINNKNLGNINYKLIKIFIFLNIVFLLVLFTSERVAMFYSFFTNIIFIIYCLKYNKKYFFLLFIPILIFFIVFTINNSFNLQIKNTVNQIIDKDNNNKIVYPSIQHRSFIYTSIELFKDNPIFGIGANNFRSYCKDYSFKYENNCSTHPHNIFFQILSETGSLGIILYLYFLFILLKKVILFIVKGYKYSNINIFFLLPVLYFLNPFFPSGNFFNNWYMAVGTFGIPFYLYFDDKISSD